MQRQLAIASDHWTAVRPDRLRAAGVIAVVVIAAAIRFRGLDSKSFWFDEFLTAHAARFESWSEVLAWLHRWIDHPPFQIVLTWLLRPVGGDEFVVRVPTALAGIASVGAMYALGSTLYRRRVGFFSAILFAVSPFAVWYAQEARPYSFVLLFTTLQMLFAARAVRDGRPRDWVALSAISILYLYTSYLALATTLAVALYVGLASAVGLARRSPTGEIPIGAPPWRARPRRFAIGAIVVGTVVVVAYLPWLPFLLEFLSRPDLGFGRIDAGHHPTIQELVELLRSVGLVEGIVLVLLVLGVLETIWAIVRGRGASHALLAAWLGVGVGILVFRAQGGVLTILPRYLAYLVPAGILLVALGADAVASAIARLVPEGRRSSAGLASFTVLVLIALVPAPRLLADVYATPKGEDYRSAARLISENAAPGAVVLTVTHNSDWLEEGLTHELWLARSTLPVFDGAALDASALDAIESATMVVLAGFDHPGDPPADPVSLPGWGRLTATGITIATSPPALSSTGAAVAGLDWAMTADIKFKPSLLVATALQPPPPGTPDLLRGVPESRWTLPAGATLDGSGALHLAPSGVQIDASVTIPLDGVPHQLVLAFECDNRLTSGSMHLYAVALETGKPWDIFPTGAGYACTGRAGEHAGAFMIDLPQGADHLMVLVRADGVGAADAQSLRLMPVPAQ